jgi:O-antigen/teichoic acid export membrane protein
MRDGATVARNAVWLIAQPLLMGVFSVVVTAFVARYLGASRYGVLLILLSYTALFTPIFNLGLRPYSVREIAASRERALEVVEDMLVLRFGLAVVAVAVAAAYLHFARHTIPGDLVWVFVLQLVTNALASCFVDGLYGIESMKAVALAMMASGIVVQLSCLGAVMLDAGLLGIATAYVLGSATLLGTSWLFFSRKVGTFKVRRPHRGHLAHIRNSSTFLFQNLVDTARQRLDVIIVNGLLGAHAAGIYGSSQSLIGRLDVVQDGISTALFARASDLHGKSPEDLKRLVRGALRAVLVISVPMAVGLHGVSDEVVRILFGAQYRESGTVLAILALSIPFGFLYGVMFNVLRAMNRQEIVFRISIVATLLGVGYMLAGILVAGVKGAAVALVLSWATPSLALLAVYWRAMGPVASPADLAGLALANAAMGILLWLIGGLPIPFKIVAGVVAYGAMTMALGLVTGEMLRMVLPLSRRAEP